MDAKFEEKFKLRKNSGQTRLVKDNFCEQAKGLIDSVLNILTGIIDRRPREENGSNEESESELDLEEEAENENSEEDVFEDLLKALDESQSKVGDILRSIKSSVLDLPFSDRYPIVPWLSVLSAEVTRDVASKCSLLNLEGPPQAAFFLEPLPNDEEVDQLEREAKKVLKRAKLERELMEDLRREYIELIAEREFLVESEVR